MPSTSVTLVGSPPSSINIGIGECVHACIDVASDMAIVCPVFYLECDSEADWFDHAATKVLQSAS